MELGKRLAKVAQLVMPAHTIADVGCDHGYLSIYLAERGKCRHVIAMDVNKGPLQKAEENIRKFGFGDYIETRLSNGLDKLKCGEAEGYVCAGMGGPLALQIMWNDRDKIKGMKQIILQPQSEIWLVRRTLKQWGFVIEQEDVEQEEGKYYFMMRICPGEHFSMDVPPAEDTSLTENIVLGDGHDDKTIEDCLRKAAYELFAEGLIAQQNPLLKEYIQKEEKRLAEIRNELLGRENSVKSEKRLEMIEKELAIHRWALARYE